MSQTEEIGVTFEMMKGLGLVVLKGKELIH